MRIDFYGAALATGFLGRDQRCAAAREWIKHNGAAQGAVFYRVGDKCDRY